MHCAFCNVMFALVLAGKTFTRHIFLIRLNISRTMWNSYICVWTFDNFNQMSCNYFQQACLVTHDKQKKLYLPGL